MQLESLIETVEKIIRDSKYEELRKTWKDFYELKGTKRVLSKITFTMTFFAENLNLDLVNHYEKPKQYIEDSLKILRFQHEEISDDRVLGGIVINFGEVFESSLFGQKPIFKHDVDPILGEPIIKTEEDFDNLQYPDFYESGLMPKILELYEAAEKILEGRIPVFFERWDRSPWGVAVHLRGFTKLIVDTFRNPDLVHKLLAFVTESRMKWEREKQRFLGTKTQSASLYNDEVDAGIISPKIYRTFAHPYEQKLADFYPRGIFYFHSCGDITPFLETISTIRGLRRLHISEVTNFEKAIKKFKGKFAFQKRMHTINDLELCDAHTMKKKIEKILEKGREAFMELDPGPIQNQALEKIKKWIKVARETTTRANVTAFS